MKTAGSCRKQVVKENCRVLQTVTENLQGVAENLRVLQSVAENLKGVAEHLQNRIPARTRNASAITKECCENNKERLNGYWRGYYAAFFISPSFQ